MVLDILVGKALVSALFVSVEPDGLQLFLLLDLHAGRRHLGMPAFETTLLHYRFKPNL